MAIRFAKRSSFSISFLFLELSLHFHSLFPLHSSQRCSPSPDPYSTALRCQDTEHQLHHRPGPHSTGLVPHNLFSLFSLYTFLECVTMSFFLWDARYLEDLLSMGTPRYLGVGAKEAWHGKRGGFQNTFPQAHDLFSWLGLDLYDYISLF